MNEELDLIALSFFKIFAQYEYFLKKTGFFQVRNGKIIVDWDGFVNERIGNDFLKILGKSASSAEYILENPPKKQVAIDGRIVWEDVSAAERNVQALFGHISRVRNNLFHGAKFNGTWFDPERSKKLLIHSLCILESFKEQRYIVIED